MKNPICLMRALWRSKFGQRVSGCDYVEETPAGGVLATVQVLRCSTCGTVSVGWEPAPTPPRGETP